MLLIRRNLCLKNIWHNKKCFVISSRRNHHSVISRKISVIQSMIDRRRLKYLKLQKCDFRTTQHLYISPNVVILLRPVLNLGALLMGRGIRKWWMRKSEQEQEELKRWSSERVHIFAGCLGIYGLILFIYYITHLEIDPLTQRTRFLIFNKEEEKQLEDIFLNVHLKYYEEHLVPRDSDVYKKFLKLTNQIVTANKELKSIRETKWSLNIIDTPIESSYTLPGGHIFISKNILKIIENDDQLGIILAHEIAHTLLSHSFERLSNDILLDFIIAIPILLVWALFPGMTAVTIYILGEAFLNLLYKYPYSRKLENEADEIGIILAAKACFDIREAVVFWATKRKLVEMELQEQEPSWISSHPSHATREKNVSRAMAKALKLQKDSGCPVLPTVDPRSKVYKRSEQEWKSYFEQRGITSEQKE